MSQAYLPEEDRSYRQIVQDLEVNETFSRSVRFEYNATTWEELQETGRVMRLAMQPTVHRVGRDTRQTYTIECVKAVTSTGSHIIVTLAITRLS